MKVLSRMKGESGVVLLIEVLAFVIIFSLAVFRGLMVIDDDAIAIRALDKQGYREIMIKDRQWFFVGFRGCGADAAKFTTDVTNPAGKRVEVFVCVGWPFKGATVRTD